MSLRCWHQSGKERKTKENKSLINSAVARLWRNDIKKMKQVVKSDFLGLPGLRIGWAEYGVSGSRCCVFPWEFHLTTSQKTSSGFLHALRPDSRNYLGFKKKITTLSIGLVIGTKSLVVYQSPEESADDNQQVLKSIVMSRKGSKRRVKKAEKRESRFVTSPAVWPDVVSSFIHQSMRKLKNTGSCGFHDVDYYYSD